MSFIFIHSIRNIKFSTKFMTFKLHFSVIFNRNLILVQIQIKAHIVNDFKVNLLLNINNMILKNIIIDLIQKQAIFELCKNAIIKLNIIFKSNHQVTCSIYSNAKIVVLSHSEVRISIQQHKFTMKLSFDQDYIFESASNQLTYYIHTMNAELLFTHAVNQTDHSITISCRTQIDHLI